jgi:hypothetical protein
VKHCRRFGALCKVCNSVFTFEKFQSDLNDLRNFRARSKRPRCGSIFICISPPGAPAQLPSLR